MVGRICRIEVKAMRTIGIPILSAILFASGSGPAFAAPRLCTGEARTAVCLLSFGDLWDSRSDYSGRSVRLNGYLVSGFGRLLLYPSKDYFTFQRASGGIAIEVDRATFDAAKARMRPSEDGADWKFSSPCPVTVVGIYSDKPSGDSGSLGVIETDGAGLMIPAFQDTCSLPEAVLLPTP